MGLFAPGIARASLALNRITYGPPGFTLCARAWEARLNGSAAGRFWVRILNWAFWLDPDHCRKSWLKRTGALA